MLVIRDSSSLPHLADPEMRALIQRRMQEFAPDDDLETVFVVVEPGDGLDALDAQLGFPVLANRFDGRRFGDPQFAPTFDVLEEHANVYEVIFVLSQDGAGVVILIPKHPQVDATLLSLCATYVSQYS